MHALPVAAASVYALLQQPAAPFLGPLYPFSEQEAAAKNAFAVRASEACALLQQLQRPRFVLRNAVTRIAAACQCKRERQAGGMQRGMGAPESIMDKGA